MKKIIIVTLTLFLASCASVKRSNKQVKETVVKMVNAIDTKEWKIAIDKFDKEVFVDYSSMTGQAGSIIPGKNLVGSWEKLLAKAETHHMLTNFDVNVENDTAEVFSHVYATHSAKGVKYWDIYGRYHHKLKKTDKGWKITFMKLIVHGQKGNKKFLQQVGK